MRSRRSGIASLRLDVARECLAPKVEEVFQASPPAARSMKALASQLASAVPEVRARGLAFAVGTWYGKGDTSPMAKWCFEWFTAHEPLRRMFTDEARARNDAASRVAWLLAREPAELRFLTREAEAMLDQLKRLAAGYADEAERGGRAGTP